MAVRHMRLAFGLLLLTAGSALLVVRFAAPEVAARINSPMRLLIGASLGVVLGALNVAKWYAGWLAHESAATPVRWPLQPDPAAQSETGVNPDFDFGKPTELNRK
jgi:hypothetical protein